VELERSLSSRIDFSKGLQNCKLCELHKTRLNTLAGEGNRKADLMLIAQAPGELEDKANKIFIGPSGAMLDKLLNHVKISRDEIYITNLIKCILPQNRRPKQKEIDTCSKYLDVEIAEIEPKIIAPLGYYATKYLFEKDKLNIISRKDFPALIGKLFIAENYQIFPISHPASLLYHDEFIARTYEHFSNLKRMISKY
jgi:uracil-DNA glycosylase